MKNIIRKKIQTQILRKKSHICIGLDSNYEKLPNIIKKNATKEDAIFRFNKELVDATHDLVIAYKPNLVFYGAHGIDGYKALERSMAYIKTNYPDILLIAESKRTEVGMSQEMAIKEIFEQFHFDALNIMPWYGEDSVDLIRKLPNKAVFVICHDTNPSAREFQDVELANGKIFYEKVADHIANKWNTSGNVFIETALTYPSALKKIKAVTDDRQFFLIVGLGAQGGDLKNLNIFKKDRNFTVSASRSIIFASAKPDFAQAARSKVQEYTHEIKKIFST